MAVTALSKEAFQEELKNDTDMQSALEAQMYFRYAAIVEYPEFFNLLQLHIRGEDRTEIETTEYYKLRGKILNTTRTPSEILDFTLEYHSTHTVYNAIH